MRINRLRYLSEVLHGRFETLVSNSYNIANVDLECVRKAFEISLACGFQTMAYDFLYDANGQIKFCEMSYAYIDTAVFNCAGFWDTNLNWHEGHFWPQYFHLMDTLNIPDLKQPK